MYVTPSLRPLIGALTARLPGCAHPWGPALAWVLRTRVILGFPLLRTMAGFTNPLLPLILVDRRLLRRSSAAAAGAAVATPDLLLDASGRLADPAAGLLAQLVLHEAAHQLWAVWPEWRRWFGLRRIYGPQINAADAIAEAVCRELCAHTRYPGQAISYRSPLRFLGPAFRR